MKARKSFSLCQCDDCFRKEVKIHKRITSEGKNMLESSIAKYVRSTEVGGTEISFIQLLTYLTSSSKWIKAAPIKIPETLLYKNKQPMTFYYYNAHHREVKVNYGPYNIPRITRVITLAQRKRFCPKDKRKLFPTVIVQLTDGYKLLTESEFIRYMTKRLNSDHWKDVKFVQNYILNNGLASPFEYNHRTVFGKSNDQIPVSVGSLESDEKLKDNMVEYAKKICNVLGYYLLKVHNLELLSAIFTFMRDGEGDLWLSNGKEIIVRTSQHNDNEGINKLNFLKIRDMKIELSKEGSVKALILSEAMKTGYEGLKKDIGISNNEIKLKKESELDNAFRRLRPEVPYKLSEMISLRFCPKELLRKREEEGRSISIEDKKLADTMPPEQLRLLYLHKTKSPSFSFKRITYNAPSLTNNRQRSFNRVASYKGTVKPNKVVHRHNETLSNKALIRYNNFRRAVYLSNNTTPTAGESVRLVKPRSSKFTYRNLDCIVNNSRKVSLH